jgi:hypothetical protein
MSTATPEAVNGDAPPISDPTDPEAAPERPPEPPQPDEPQPPADPDAPPDGDQPADTPPNEAQADLPNGDDHASDEAIELILGSDNQLSLSVGGKKPTASEFKVVGGAVAVEGQFKKGDIVRAHVTLRVGEVAFADKVDGEGTITDTTRRHKARIESIRRIES